MKSNPFATRFVAPGRVHWISHDNHSVEQLADSFNGPLRRRAAIIGRHGTGKSTLLEHLLPNLGEVCYRQASDGKTIQLPGEGDVIVVQLRRTSDPSRQLRDSVECWRKGRLLVLDGFEQLRGPGRAWVILRTRWKRMGLLVTAHSSVGLPILCQTSVNTAMAREIVSAILRKALQADPRSDAFPTGNLDLYHDLEHLLPDLLDRNHGNMREVLMELYDELATPALK